MGKILFPQIPQGKKQLFLEAFADTGQLRASARIAACDKKMHYYWYAHDPDYRLAFDQAKAMAADALEDEATRRAMGWEETRYTDDGTPYAIQKFSDTLLIFRLKAAKPDEYRDLPKRDERSDVSELLKAVLLELAERQPGRNVTPEASWAPLPPDTRPREHNGTPKGLPPPPAVEEED